MGTGLNALRTYIGRRLRPRRDVVARSADDLVELAHWSDKPPLRLLVPARLLRMQGAFVYGPDHPFVCALREGRPALERFYAACRPSCLADFYDLDRTGRVGEDLPTWEIPWYGRADRRPPPGELGLPPEHGISFHGPVTAAKIDLELARLDALRKTLDEVGYAPDAYGDIEGYVIRHGPAACFFVRGGKHRAAVLTERETELIPVAFRSGFPRLVDSSQKDWWPLVRAGRIDPALAAELAACYVAGRNDRGGRDERID